MGGNAFTNATRIKRNEIEPTLFIVACSLGIKELNLPTLLSNMLGSTGKQDTSGDIDIAVCENTFPPSILTAIAQKIRLANGPNSVLTKTIKSNQIQSLWSICGNEQLGFTQIDFVYGNLEWLKFSHWSPGLDISPYKGVWISTLLGVLTKLRPCYQLWEESELDKPLECRDLKKRIAQVNWSYNLEKGINRVWRIRHPKNQTLTPVSADYWETNLPTKELPPRFPRCGYITDPNEVVRIILGDGIKPDAINTFEKAWKIVVEKSKEGYFPNIEHIKTSFVKALLNSSAKMTKENIQEILNKPVFK